MKDITQWYFYKLFTEKIRSIFQNFEMDIIMVTVAVIIAELGRAHLAWDTPQYVPQSSTPPTLDVLRLMIL